jgi:hypothetical protein
VWVLLDIRARVKPASIYVSLPLAGQRGDMIHHRRNHFRFILTLSILLAIAALAFSQAGKVLAHGSVDQSSSGPWQTGCGPGPGCVVLAQEFTPSVSPLYAVAITIGDQQPGLGNTTATVTVRAGAADTTGLTGPILATASLVNPPAPGGGAFGLVHFDFASPVTVTPGQVYTIQYTATTTRYHWIASLSSVYAGGRGYRDGFMAGDWHFQTYTTPAPALSVNDVSIAEGNSGSSQVGFQVSLSAASAQTVTVQAFTTTSGGGTASGAATTCRSSLLPL